MCLTESSLGPETDQECQTPLAHLGDSGMKGD